MVLSADVLLLKVVIETVNKMAATPGEESVYESGRLSLLDLIFEKNRAQNKVGYKIVFFSLHFILSWYFFA
jgi:hypothetical protein